MSALPPYDPKAKCPKCGGEECLTVYCDGVRLRYYRSPCEFRSPRDEHLHRTCKRCQYGWLERTAPTAGEGG